MQDDVIGLIDSSMNEVVTYSYDTWGKLLSIGGSLASTVGVKNPYCYRGYRYDTETGLYYLQSRYYDPNTGRFVNADDTDQLTSYRDDLLDINLFTYCNNNPVMMKDSDGQFAIADDAVYGICIITFVACVGIAYVASTHSNKRSWNGFCHSLKASINSVKTRVINTWRSIKSVVSKIVKHFTKSRKRSSSKKAPKIKYPGNDPSKSPGKGWEWRGKGTPKSGKGNWYNPKTGERLNPDLNHGDPVGPHWDYTAPDGSKWRVFPNGNITSK